VQKSKTGTSLIDWQNGTWRSPDVMDPTAEIIIAGDWAPIRDFSDTILANPEAVYGDLLPMLQGCHLRMVNLESPLVEEGTPIHKSGTVLKGVSGHISGLTTVPFEVATLGNNHVFDYGIDAFVHTRDLLHQHGIQSTGAGMSLAEAEKPLKVTANGVNIGIISFSEGEDLTAAADGVPGVLGWEIERVIERVKEIRSRVHVIVVICHGGVEYLPFPPPYLADALQRIAKAGADLVIGHHPHVPQGVQVHNGVPICYSLGNFVFFQPTDLLYRKIGYLVKAGLTTEGVSTIRIIPYEIGSDRLMLLKDEKLRRALKKLGDLSAPLTRTDGIADAWNGFLKHYGTSGFLNEISGILDHFENERPKGAAMFRNRLTTLQHYHHLKDLMTRIIDGTLDHAPEWAVAEVEAYFTRKVTEGLPS
jgi:poly-gamma-glutamate capsule biosynthesis protein CapA/YwtB (metallophosphatase superfamily)